MNELLQKHGCSNVFSLPEGLKELMSDISREVLREQPPALYEFIANYLSALLITREHGILAVRVLDDLCDCRPTVTEHLHWLGIGAEDVKIMVEVIKTGIEGKDMFASEMTGEEEMEFKEETEENEAEEGHETVREMKIMKAILNKVSLDETMCTKVCQVIRNAYRDYWYRKKLLEKELKLEPETPWEIAAEHTLNLYKKTKPSMTELNRASERIQAAYKGYHVRKNILAHLKKPKEVGPKRERPGPPVDIADSREIDLGDVIKLQVKEDDVAEMFKRKEIKDLGLAYDPMMAITHDESKKKALKLQIDESSAPIFEKPNSSLETAQQAVRDLIFTPKPSKEQIHTSKELKTDMADKNIVVVVPPKKIDSICMCEEELDEAINFETTGIPSEKPKKVVIATPEKSINEVESKKPITPQLLITPVETEAEKIPEEAKVDKDNKLVPDNNEIVYRAMSVSETPSETMIVQNKNQARIEEDKIPSETIVEETIEVKNEEEKALEKTVVIQTFETIVRLPILSPLHQMPLPAILEVDEKSTTSSSFDPSEPSSSLESTTSDYLL